MIKIYGTENSRAMRPIWTAEEMGLDYEKREYCTKN